MAVLFDEMLVGREFSSHLLNVADLLDWVKAKNYHLVTSPPLSNYEFVQVEALLCAIERGNDGLTHAQADAIVATHKKLKNDPAANKNVSPWMLGGEAHSAWCELLTNAIKSRELELLEFGSKLPVDAGTLPAMASDSSDSNLDERVFLAAFAESVTNGAEINWQYWVRDMSTLEAGEAARLMCGLEPDLFKNLDSRPNKNDPTKLCQKAAKIERLALRQGKDKATAVEWLAWARSHRLVVHDGFELEVKKVGDRQAQPCETPPPAPEVIDAHDWVSEVRSRACEIIKERKAKDLYPSQVLIADQIASERRQAGKVGADGKPLSGAYIKRHALKGISSASGKQLSTKIRQGK